MIPLYLYLFNILFLVLLVTVINFTDCVELDTKLF